MPLPRSAVPRTARLLAVSALLALAACQSGRERAAALGAQAQQLYDAQRYFEASQLLFQATAARDDIPDIWLLLGRTRLAMKDYGGAFSAYRTALDLDRANREALAAVAQLSLNRGDYSGADDYGTQIQSLAPDDTLAALVRGFAAIGQQRYADADAMIAPLIQADPTNAAALVIRSMALERQGRVEQALAVLQPAASQDSPDLLGQMERLYERTANPKGAVALLRRQLQLAPRNPAFTLGLVRQLYGLGRGADAATLLASLHARAPSDDLRANTVAVWMDSAVAPATIAASVAALPQAPAELRLALAQYLLARDAPQQAMTVLADVPPPAAATLADVDRQGALALAEVSSGRGPTGGARAAAALALDRTQPYALIARARLALASGDLDSALRDTRLVLRDNPQLPLGYRLLADIYSRQGDAQLADRAMDDGAAAMPDSAEFLMVNNARLLARGDVEEANNTARDFTVRNPAWAAGWVVRGQVCARTRDTACSARAAAIRARLAGAATPLPEIPESERPSDQVRMSI